jgi:hypothetical protein
MRQCTRLAAVSTAEKKPVLTTEMDIGLEIFSLALAFSKMCVFHGCVVLVLSHPCWLQVDLLCLMSKNL